MTAPCRPLLLAAAAAVALAACTSPAGDPLPGEASPTAAAPSASASPTPSPASPEDTSLAALVDELAEALAAIRSDLEATAGGDDRSADALRRLVAVPESVLAAGTVLPEPDDPGESGDAEDGPDPDPTDAPAAVLPGPSDGDRVEAVVFGDLVTRLQAAARSAGASGEAVARLLADPLAGDLGAWQRAADDQLAAIGAAVAGASDLDAATPDVLALDGEVPRATAWTVLGIARPELAAGAAERALAHLTVVDAAVTDLTGD